MKKTIVSALLALTMLLTLSACGGGSNSPLIPGRKGLQDYATYTERFMKKDLPSYVTPTEEPGLYATGITSETADSFEAQGHYAYLYTFDYPEDSYADGSEVKVEVFDLSDGSRKGEIHYISTNHSGPTNDGFWYVDTEYQLNLTDAAGNVLSRTDVSFIREHDEEYTISFTQVTPDGQWFYCRFDSDDCIHVLNLSTGESFTILLDSAQYLCVVQNSEVPSVYGNSWYTLDFEKKEAVYQGESNNVYWAGDGVALLSESNGFRFFETNGYTKLYSFPMEGYVTSACGPFVCMDFWEEGNESYRFYDVLNDRCLGAITDDENFYSSMYLTEEGYVVLFREEETEDAVSSSLFLIDLRKLEGGTDSPGLMFKTGQEDSIVKELTDAFRAETGIEILYGSQGNDFDLFDYVGRISLNSYRNYRAAEEIIDALRIYPDGAFADAVKGYKGIRLYLCDTLYGVGGNGLDRAGAVTFEDRSYLAVAFDVTQYDLKSNVAHEFSHVFDYCLKRADRDLDDAWEEYSPEGSYGYSYADYDTQDQTRYTLFDDHEEDVYFIDSYSRINPGEDRARIAEHLIFETEETIGDSVFAQYPHLREKAQCYCQLYREAIPSFQNADVLPWEAALASLD